MQDLIPYFNTPDGGNLFGEFIDTLILAGEVSSIGPNQPDLSRTQAIAVWLLVTTPHRALDANRKTIARAFIESEDGADLAAKWLQVLETALGPDTEVTCHS